MGSTRGNSAKWIDEAQRREQFKLANLDPARKDPRDAIKTEMHDLVLARVYEGRSKQEIWDEISQIEVYKNAYPLPELFMNALKNMINSEVDKKTKGEIQVNKTEKEI